MRTVTKKELVARIADATGQSKAVVRDLVQLFLDEIVRELARGNRIEFREFGIFESRERAPRKAQNPKTREQIEIPPTRVVRFRVGQRLRRRVERLSPEGEPPRPGRSGGEPHAPPTKPPPGR